MRESDKDPVRLEHIINAIDKLLNADSVKSFDEINEKDLEYFGIVKLLEIIGEAAYKLTNEFKETHTDTMEIYCGDATYPCSWLLSDQSKKCY